MNLIYYEYFRNEVRSIQSVLFKWSFINHRFHLMFLREHLVQNILIDSTKCREGEMMLTAFRIAYNDILEDVQCRACL